MAPEQWAGHPVAATDQYALAVMAYELLVGHPPFQGPPMSLMYLHTTTLPPPPSSVNPRLSRDLDAVLMHALAKRPEQRFASIIAFANAFQQVAQPMPAAGPPPLAAAPPTPIPVNSGDLRAVLAISTAEAQTGTTRTLTLPGGRQVIVNVPAGVRDGHIVRLDRQGKPSPTGGPAGALILSILVQSDEEPPLSATSTDVAEKTVLTANPTTPPAWLELPTSPSSLVELTSMATSAGQTLLPPTELPFPAMPSIGWPADRSSQPSAPIIAYPRQGLSRRTVAAGLAGLAVIGVASCGLLLTTNITTVTTTSTVVYSVGKTLTTYRGHSDSVYAVTWSPDSTHIASGSLDRTVQVWDAANGGYVYAYRGHAGHVFTVAWSPDGKRIASGGEDHTVQVWDATNGGNVFTYRGHSNIVYAVACSPDGKSIASGSADKTVQVWVAG